MEVIKDIGIISSAKNAPFDEAIEFYDAMDIIEDEKTADIDSNGITEEFLQKEEEINELNKQLESERSEKSDLLSLISKLNTDVQSQIRKKSMGKDKYENEVQQLSARLKEMELEKSHMLMEFTKQNIAQNTAPYSSINISELSTKSDSALGSVNNDLDDDEDMDAYMSSTSNDIIEDLIVDTIPEQLTSAEKPPVVTVVTVLDTNTDTPRKKEKKRSIQFDVDTVYTIHEEQQFTSSQVSNFTTTLPKSILIRSDTPRATGHSSSSGVSENGLQYANADTDETLMRIDSSVDTIHEQVDDMHSSTTPLVSNYTTNDVTKSSAVLTRTHTPRSIDISDIPRKASYTGVERIEIIPEVEDGPDQSSTQYSNYSSQAHSHTNTSLGENGSMGVHFESTLLDPIKELIPFSTENADEDDYDAYMSNSNDINDLLQDTPIGLGNTADIANETVTIQSNTQTAAQIKREISNKNTAANSALYGQFQNESLLHALSNTVINAHHSHTSSLYVSGVDVYDSNIITVSNSRRSSINPDLPTINEDQEQTEELMELSENEHEQIAAITSVSTIPRVSPPSFSVVTTIEDTTSINGGNTTVSNVNRIETIHEDSELDDLIASFNEYENTVLTATHRTTNRLKGDEISEETAAATQNSTEYEPAVLKHNITDKLCLSEDYGGIKSDSKSVAAMTAESEDVLEDKLKILEPEKKQKASLITTTIASSLTILPIETVKVLDDNTITSTKAADISLNSDLKKTRKKRDTPSLDDWNHSYRTPLQTVQRTVGTATKLYQPVSSNIGLDSRSPRAVTSTELNHTSATVSHSNSQSNDMTERQLPTIDETSVPISTNISASRVPYMPCLEEHPKINHVSFAVQPAESDTVSSHSVIDDSVLISTTSRQGNYVQEQDTMKSPITNVVDNLWSKYEERHSENYPNDVDLFALHNDSTELHMGNNATSFTHGERNDGDNHVYSLQDNAYLRDGMRTVSPVVDVVEYQDMDNLYALPHQQSQQQPQSKFSLRYDYNVEGQYDNAAIDYYHHQQHQLQQQQQQQNSLNPQYEQEQYFQRQSGNLSRPLPTKQVHTIITHQESQFQNTAANRAEIVYSPHNTKAYNRQFVGDRDSNETNRMQLQPNSAMNNKHTDSHVNNVHTSRFYNYTDPSDRSIQYSQHKQRDINVVLSHEADCQTNNMPHSREYDRYMFEKTTEHSLLSDEQFQENITSRVATSQHKQQHTQQQREGSKSRASKGSNSDRNNRHNDLNSADNRDNRNEEVYVQYNDGNSNDVCITDGGRNRYARMYNELQPETQYTRPSQQQPRLTRTDTATLQHFKQVNNPNHLTQANDKHKLKLNKNLWYDPPARVILLPAVSPERLAQPRDWERGANNNKQVIAVEEVSPKSMSSDSSSEVYNKRFVPTAPKHVHSMQVHGKHNKHRHRTEQSQLNLTTPYGHHENAVVIDKEFYLRQCELQTMLLVKEQQYIEVIHELVHMNNNQHQLQVEQGQHLAEPQQSLATTIYTVPSQQNYMYENNNHTHNTTTTNNNKERRLWHTGNGNYSIDSYTPSYAYNQHSSGRPKADFTELHVLSDNTSLEMSDLLDSDDYIYHTQHYQQQQQLQQYNDYDEYAKGFNDQSRYGNTRHPNEKLKFAGHELENSIEIYDPLYVGEDTSDYKYRPAGLVHTPNSRGGHSRSSTRPSVYTSDIHTAPPLMTLSAPTGGRNRNDPNAVNKRYSNDYERGPAVEVRYPSNNDNVYYSTTEEHSSRKKQHNYIPQSATITTATMNVKPPNGPVPSSTHHRVSPRVAKSVTNSPTEKIRQGTNTGEEGTYRMHKSDKRLTRGNSKNKMHVPNLHYSSGDEILPNRPAVSLFHDI